MLDNPNRGSSTITTTMSSSTTKPVVNVRRHNSLPASLQKLRRRSTLLSSSSSTTSPLTSTTTSKITSSRSSSSSLSSSSCSTSSLSSSSIHPSAVIPPRCPSPTSVATSSLSNERTTTAKATMQPPEYSVKVVSSRLNKSNPYIGSFRHSPPTTFRDIRFQISPMLSSSSSSSLFWTNKTNATHQYRRRSCTLASLDSYHDTIFTQLLRQAAECPHNNDHDEESFETICFRYKLLCSYLLSKQHNDEHPINDCSTTKTRVNTRTAKSSVKMSTLRTPDGRSIHISGHLPGGSPCSNKNDTAGRTSVIETATVKIVTGIASWLFHFDDSLPFIADEHTIMPKIRDTSVPTKINESNEGSCDCESSVSASDCDNDDDQSAYSNSSSDDQYSTDSSYDNYDTTHGSRTVPDDAGYYANVTSPIGTDSVTIVRPNNPLEASCLTVLSSQAEAYYAQTSVTNQLLDASISNLSNTGRGSTTGAVGTSSFITKNRSNSINSNSSSGRMDYETITQMDIVRMTRIASRHLDVVSICQLPTITYNRKQKILGHQTKKKQQKRSTSTIIEGNSVESISDTKQPAKALITNDDPVDFSWMMITTEPDDASSIPSSTTSSSPSVVGLKITTTRTTSSDEESSNTREDAEPEVDVCVICLEHFADGDRLRVLPCSHSFHVGCIDRWLSGSHSFHDCYTSGCPTCKKHPSSFRAHTTSTGTNKKKNKKTNAPTVDNEYEKRQSSHATVGCCNKNKKNRDKQKESCDCCLLEESTDGTVPSWAFANIGGALLRDSHQLY